MRVAKLGPEKTNEPGHSGRFGRAVPGIVSLQTPDTPTGPTPNEVEFVAESST